jgi:DNA polymerase-3 subunit delta'
VNAAPYPWQETQWARWEQRVRQERVPHGLLLAGPAGLGKAHFARVLAQSALCLEPDAHGQACGSCQACQLFAAGTHPDFQSLTLEDSETTGKESTQIRVDQVRELVEFMYLSRNLDRYKVAIISPAEAMNRSAANSLLKTLEEPPPMALLILVSTQPALMPSTIRSRCQRIDFQAAENSAATDWLKAQGIDRPEELLHIARGAPLQALDLGDAETMALRQRLLDQIEAVMTGRGGVVETAADWKEYDDLGRLLDWLTAWLRDMLRYRQAPEADAATDIDLAPRLSALAERLDIKKAYRLEERMLEARRQIHAGLNQDLLRESILLSWLSAMRRA